MRCCSDGPFYDPVHKLYHLFYQIHIALGMGGEGDGPDWGHWVSKVPPPSYRAFSPIPFLLTSARLSRRT